MMNNNSGKSIVRNMETQFENIETTEVRSEDILDALMVLHVKYPEHIVAIWAICNPDGKVEFTTHGEKGSQSHFSGGHKTTPFEAATSLIKVIGEYDPHKIRREKINSLREELRKLEEEGRKV